MAPNELGLEGGEVGGGVANPPLLPNKTAVNVMPPATTAPAPPISHHFRPLAVVSVLAWLVGFDGGVIESVGLGGVGWLRDIGSGGSAGLLSLEGTGLGLTSD